MFQKILIANRGEIAVRIARTAKAMGVRVVAVYSAADADALHVDVADEAVNIGPAAPADSYLNIPKIIAAAKLTGAEAIHPGYGFLSENPLFEEACVAAGLRFIGPSAANLIAMGSKAKAKDIMAKAGMPLLAGYQGEVQDTDGLRKISRDVGYPLLIKASSGGGGRGMRLVNQEVQFDELLEEAKSEAMNAFGDDHVILEKFLSNPRHVEVQVLGDNHGNVVHLFDRDCSVQRRHQKIIEEAPAPQLSRQLRKRMAEASLDAVRAIDYVGVGTFEFLVEGAGTGREEFFFMEMNTRLQVEHTVTEAVTGLDLVEWQLRVAADQVLTFTQDDIRPNGRAIECRIYAEDPLKGFLPGRGELTRYRLGGLNTSGFPRSNAPTVRIDNGYREGDRVTGDYDPQLAKIIVHASSRPEALRAMRRVLAASEIVGVPHNLQLLHRVLGHGQFAASALSTRFITTHADQLLPQPPDVLPPHMIAIFAAAEATRLAQQQPLMGWRSVQKQPSVSLVWDIGGEPVAIIIEDGNVFWRAEGSDQRFEVHCQLEPLNDNAAGEASLYRLHSELEGVRNVGLLHCEGNARRLETIDTDATLSLFEAKASDDDEQAGSEPIAPMHAVVSKVLVKAGDEVDKGQPLVVLEAMKMQHAINAAQPGTIEAVMVTDGDQVALGQVLLSFTSN